MHTKRALLLLSVALAAWGCDGGTPAPADAGTDAQTSGPGTIVEVAVANGSFTTLVAAIERAGLTATLSGSGPFTVFAPTDAAFTALGVDLSALSDDELREILLYHVIQGAEVPSSAVTAGTADSAADLTLFLGTSGGGVQVNGANVTTADVDASNGVIHVIDAVLLPPDIPAAAQLAGLTSLLAAAESAGLTSVISGEGPFTIFAPTNAAFDALGTLPAGPALVQVLTYHAILGAAVASNEVPPQASAVATNAYGDPLTLLFDTSGGGVCVNGVDVVIADVRTTNGIVHVIDEVLLPPNAAQMAQIAGLTQLLAAVGRASDIPGAPPTPVADALAAQAPYTIFAPTNAAFEAIASTLAGLSNDEVRDVLLYHLLDTTAFPSPVLLAELPSSVTDVQMLSGQTASLDPTSSPPTIDGAGIVRTDIVVTNGVIHLIDDVMIP